MKLPVISGKDVLKALSKAGFEVQRQKGSHVHLLKQAEGKNLRVTVPVHGNKDLNPFVLRSIIRQSGFTQEEFEKFL